MIGYSFRMYTKQQFSTAGGKERIYANPEGTVYDARGIKLIILIAPSTPFIRINKSHVKRMQSCFHAFYILCGS